jgi:hypothetical protein
VVLRQEVTMDRNLVLVILKDWFWRRANATSKCSKFGLQTSIVKITKVWILIHFNLVDNGVITDTVDMTVYVSNRLATKEWNR